MDNKLYSQFGGGWTKSFGSSGYFHATWPLVRLSLHEDALEYRILRQHLNMPYPEIERVQIKFVTNIVFTFKGDDTEYGFAGLGLRKVFNILQSKGVSMNEDTLRDLKFAVIGNGIFYFIFFVFMTAWLGALLWWMITYIVLT